MQYTIRPVSVSDAEELLAIYAPYVENTAVSFEYEVPTAEEFKNRIETISARLPYLAAVDEKGTILGYAYAAPFKTRKAYDWSVEATIYLRSDCRRMGLGKALYGELERRLKEIGILNMNACIAYPTTDEDAHLTFDSPRFHEKMGFAPVGTFHQSGYKFGTWYDMIWMEKMLGEHTDSQPEVRFGQWKDV